MPATTITTTPYGIHAHRVDVEADISAGLPEFRIVGLPDTAVQESRERIRHAIRNSGIKFPDTKVMINLAPAHLRKTGGQTDLAIAIAILQAAKLIPKQEEPILFLGEVSLNGDLRGHAGVLASARLANQEGIRAVFLPISQRKEAALVHGVSIFGAKTLVDVVQHLRGEKIIKQAAAWRPKERGKKNTSDISLIRGQETAKRALEIAAAGGHNLLMVGPPGSGKTLLAKALAELLPPLSWEEALEVTQIESSIENLNEEKPLITRRPFRHPHHSASLVALVGGGNPSKPGEVTRAHRGVLFLDELPEFQQRVLETLRQPLEDGEICIARARERWTYPSQCMLVAAMNPCPCGYAGEDDTTCVCLPSRRERYRTVLSGPLIDRIDITVHVARMKSIEYIHQRKDDQREQTETIRERIRRARTVQENRRKHTGVLTNSELSEKHREVTLKIGEQEENFLQLAADKLKLSARSMSRILKVARTIADLEEIDSIQKEHLAEALQFRKPF